MPHSIVWYESFIILRWRIHMCDMTPWYVWHVSFICVTWLMRPPILEVLRLPTCVTWLIHICDMSYLHVWHAALTWVPWLIHTCDMTHSHVRHDSLICATWVTCSRTIHLCATWCIRMCDMTHSYVWHDSFECVTWLIHTCDRTHSYLWHDSYTCDVSDIFSVRMWHDSFTCDMTHSHVTHSHVFSVCGLPKILKNPAQSLMCSPLHIQQLFGGTRIFSFPTPPNSTKCLVNWILPKIRFRSRNTHSYLNVLYIKQLFGRTPSQRNTFSKIRRWYNLSFFKRLSFFGFWKVFAMGWLRSVGSIKSYVSFAEYRLFYRALLQKRPIFNRSW